MKRKWNDARKVVQRNFRLTVLNGNLEGKQLYCRDVLGATISYDKFKQMVESGLRCMGLSADISSVEIFWDNDRIECELHFFEMWITAVEDGDGFVTLNVFIVSGGVDMDVGGDGVDMASSRVLMENLDKDVLQNILFRLPFGTAAQAKRVCKSWKTILDVRRHNEAGFLLACTNHSLNRTYLYFGEECDHIDGNKQNCYYSQETLMEMEHCKFFHNDAQCDILVGSCNGLVCLRKEDPDDKFHEPFAICNPLLGEFIFLKANFSRVWESPAAVVSGFGYCQATGEYMVVRVCTLVSEERSYAQVYTIGGGEWEDFDRFTEHTFYVNTAPGIFANGVLHWLADAWNFGIVTFDLEDVKFGELPLPPPEVLKTPGNELKLLGGNLCWVKNDRWTQIDIWAYKEKNLNTRNSMEEHDQKRDYYSGSSWNWVKEFSIECNNREYEPFAITKSNQVLLLGRMNLYCYDPGTCSISELGDTPVDLTYFIQAIPHTNSYVSLKRYWEELYYGGDETWYGPGCSAVPRTNSNVPLLKVKDAFNRRDKSKDALVFGL